MATAQHDTSKYSEPEYAQPDKKKTEYPWYLENIDKYLLPEVLAQ